MKYNSLYATKSPQISSCFYTLIVMIILSIVTFLTIQCDDDEDKSLEVTDIWDIDSQGIPEFVATDYIELSKIFRISKFRSGIGHDYSDVFEDCRSMKHYFEPKSDIDWSSVKIYSPVTGKITRVEQEWAGTKLEICCDEYPAFRFTIFHMNPIQAFSINDQVSAGQQLGSHIGSQTMSDIAVIVNDPTRQGRMISYFEVMSDQVFDTYKARGINDKTDVIISKAMRDANPLVCNGDTFTSTDSLECWIVLN